MLSNMDEDLRNLVKVVKKLYEDSVESENLIKGIKNFRERSVKDMDNQMIKERDNFHEASVENEQMIKMSGQVFQALKTKTDMNGQLIEGMKTQMKSLDFCRENGTTLLFYIIASLTELEKQIDSCVRDVLGRIGVNKEFLAVYCYLLKKPPYIDIFRIPSKDLKVLIICMTQVEFNCRNNGLGCNIPFLHMTMPIFDQIKMMPEFDQIRKQRKKSVAV